MKILSDPFDKIHEDLWNPLRPQREWIERQGLLLVLGHFFSGIGAGTWFISWLNDYTPGLVISILIVAIASGGTHLAFLGQPLRFWRMVTTPQSSWISRGLISMAVFIPFASLHAFFKIAGIWGQSPLIDRLVFSLAFLGMAGIMAYKGFVYAVSKAIPFWNNPILPFLYIAYGLRGGAAVVLLAIALSGSGSIDIRFVESIKFWIVISTAVLILLYLSVMWNGGVAANRSTLELIFGRVSLAFYLGLVGAGLIIPAGIGIWGLFGELGRPILVLISISSLIGDFYVKYCVNKAGIYVPIIGQFPYKAHRV
jgi:formate-dependent nitrite reductase membrane component NrfD